MKSPNDVQEARPQSTIRTFIDAGVLIAAARGVSPLAERALAIIGDPQREFVASVFLKLEVQPKAVYHSNHAEAEFYQTSFDSVSHWVDDLDSTTQRALSESCACGLGAVDALHIAAAQLMGAVELVTIEKPEKPIHRARALRVVTIAGDQAT